MGEPIMLREILDKVQLAFNGFFRARKRPKKKKRKTTTTTTTTKNEKERHEKFTNERQNIFQRRDDNFSTFDV